ncbi:MAG: MerR family transcriptional regulator [Candidatus Melainabacteria bacterium]|nr:MAG: MerR family transcriptional regulator [Candidatus Melainabacteria bacterium]
MTSQDLISINNVASRLGLSVHQLRRWELMFGLDIKRGRGQQRQYRPEDMAVLERIRELVEQGWPTSQIRPQLESEGLITPKLIGTQRQIGDADMLSESIIGLRSFCERRFIEMSRQMDEMRQLIISLKLRQEIGADQNSPWQAMPAGQDLPAPREIEREPDPEPTYQEPEPPRPVQNFEFGPQLSVADSTQIIEPPAQPEAVSEEDEFVDVEDPTDVHFGEVTDQNYLTLLGRALDTIGWTDEEADEYSDKNFSVAHWDELGRSQAEKLVAHITELLNKQA